MPIAHDRPVIRTREELVSFLFELMDENDAIKWENDTAYAFLQGLAAWLHDAGGYYSNIGEPRDVDAADWQLFADALSAATVYE